MTGCFNQEYNSRIYDAAERGDVDGLVMAVREWPHLIDTGHPLRLERSPMFVAAERGHAAAVEALHRLGSTALVQRDRYGWSPLDAAASNGHVSVVETLYRLGAEHEARSISIAVQLGKVSVVELLIRLGHPTVARDGVQLLLAAFESDRTAVAELLLAAGVDAAELADDWPEHVQALLATPAERLQRLRYGLYFSSTLLDALLR